ncbi:nose resistant to fluoxetine protein 6-like [Ischnura elegans]|uniref:nose resistant to fluoxetine protein 6-like n=1 Tax=Ischnura elegans TaxID=197161 RepID=UPI001ED8A454|nr:nose resistant to fluoxetine protein 6-like [Ischnura elegans]
MKIIELRVAIWFVFILNTLTAAKLPSKKIELEKEQHDIKWSVSAKLFDAFYQSTDDVANEICSNDMKFYLQELSKITPWAIEMFDASAKLPSGLLDGNLRHLGHYDECLNIEVKSQEGNENTAKSTRFSGQYCLVRINFDWKNASRLSEEVTKNSLLLNIDNALDKMMLGRRGLEDRHKDRDPQAHMPVIPIFSLSQWAVCIPSTCTQKDIEIYMQKIINILTSMLPESYSMLNITARIDKEACTSHSHVNLANVERWTSNNSFTWFMIFLISISIVGTCCDLITPTENEVGKPNCYNLTNFPGRNILLSFSIPANINKILAAGSRATRNPSTTLDCLDGTRFLSTIWVTLTHKVLLLTQEPFMNKGHLKESLASLFWVPLTANMMSVDSFFLIGGLLRGYNYSNDLDEGKSNQVSSVIQRYLRLTPALAVMIWFYITTLHRVYYGPEWDIYCTSASVDCRESWWLNLLYINNYFGFPRLCVLQSWYLSADMQLFIVSPILLYPLWYTYKNKDGYQKYLGAIPMISTIIASMAAQFIITYRNGYPALFRVWSKDQILLDYIQYIHMSTHTRMGPYILGLMIGFVLHNLRGKNLHLSKLTVIFGWTMSFSLFVFVLYGPYSTLQMGTPQQAFPDSLYASTHRISWAIALGWLVFASCKGYGGPINQILSARIFKQLSNIAYCMFLVHFAVLLTNLGSIRSADYKDQYKLVREFIADVVVTMVFSVILYLLVEAPFSSITSIIFKKGKKTEKKDVQADNPEKSKKL